MANELAAGIALELANAAAAGATPDVGKLAMTDITGLAAVACAASCVITPGATGLKIGVEKGIMKGAA